MNKLIDFILSLNFKNNFIICLILSMLFLLLFPFILVGVFICVFGWQFPMAILESLQDYLKTRSYK